MYVRTLISCSWKGYKLFIFISGFNIRLFMYDSCFVVQLQSCVQLFDPMSCSTPGSSVLHYLLEYAQTHVHWVGDTIQPSHPLWLPSPLPSVFPSIGVFSNESALCIRWTEYWALASVLAMNIRGWFPFGSTGLISLQSKELSRVFSSTIIRNYQFFGIQSFYGPILTSIRDYWKNHSFDYMDLCWESDVSAF